MYNTIYTVKQWNIYKPTTTLVLTYEHTPRAERPKELVITASHAPAATKNPTVITIMANPKRFSGNSHTMKIFMNDITVKLNVNVITLIRIHWMLSAGPNFKAKKVLISACIRFEPNHKVRWGTVRVLRFTTPTTTLLFGGEQKGIHHSLKTDLQKATAKNIASAA